MNNKGFSLVELIGVMVILAVLSTIAITSFSQYTKQSREKSYKILSQSIYEAYQNCMVQSKCTYPTVGNDIVFTDFKWLVDNGYLDNLKNPNKNQADCNGSMIISVEENPNSAVKEYSKYKYKVNLNCSPKSNIIYNWPEDKIK